MLPSETTTTHPLEEALARAVAEGLAPNLQRQMGFLGDRELWEVQALKVQGTNPRFPDNVAARSKSIDGVVRLVEQMERKGNAAGIFLVQNVLDPEVEAQAELDVPFVMKKGESTSDREIKARTVALVDLDWERPKNISTTDEQMLAVADCAVRVHADLRELLDGDEALSYMHSGNCRTIGIALDNLDCDESEQPVREVLACISAFHGTAKIAPDMSVVDRKRINTAAGTTKRKGNPKAEGRPHRRTGIVCSENPRRLSLDELRDLSSKLRERLTPEQSAKADDLLGIKKSKSRSANTTSTSPSVDPAWERANRVEIERALRAIGCFEGEQVVCPGCGMGDGSSVAIVENGLKCLHARCASRGLHGFYTPVDAVAEKLGIEPHEAVAWMAERFVFEGFAERQSAHSNAMPADELFGAEQNEPAPTAARRSSNSPQRTTLRRLGDLLEPALARVERRANSEEKPVPVPWSVLEPHFGGGLWPGVHYITKGTGIGGSQLAFQLVLHAAKQGFPAFYVALEMSAYDTSVRTVGLDAKIPWSDLWLGRAGPAQIAAARQSAAALRDLPIYVETASAMAFSVPEIAVAFERFRAQHPGEQALLGIIDFVQLVGDPPGQSQELRQRIASAAYALREIAVRLNIAIVAISSVARERLKILADIVHAASLTWEEDHNGCPINRRILDPDAIVGLGKESGEIEYSGDSVTVLSRVPGTWNGSGCDIIVATAKGRATGAMWSPFHFTGFRYEECSDRGGRLLEAWKQSEEKRARKRAERQEKRQAEKAEGVLSDAVAVVKYIRANPRCRAGAARRSAVKDSSARWDKAVEVLGDALSSMKAGKGLALCLDESLLTEEVRSCLD